jgi:hypothetical protein
MRITYKHCSSVSQREEHMAIFKDLFPANRDHGGDNSSEGDDFSRRGRHGHRDHDHDHGHGHGRGHDHDHDHDHGGY